MNNVNPCTSVESKHGNSEEEKKNRRREYRREYRKTEAYKNAKREYRKTEAYRNELQRYYKTEAYKNRLSRRRREYRKTEAYKKERREYTKRSIGRMADWYIKRLLSDNAELRKSGLPPNLIELKKRHLTLCRLLKEGGKQQTTYNL